MSALQTTIPETHQKAIESMAAEMFEEDFGYTASKAPSTVMNEYFQMASEYFFESMAS